MASGIAKSTHSDSNRFSGTVAGNVVTFKYQDNTFHDGPHRGTGKITLSADRKTFAMHLANPTLHKEGDYTGHRSPGTNKAVAASLGGTWVTQFGPIQLRVNGDSVTSTYKNGGAHLDGKLVAGVVYFTYRDTTFKDGVHEGTGVLTLAPDHKSFTARWVSKVTGKYTDVTGTHLPSTVVTATHQPAGGK